MLAAPTAFPACIEELNSPQDQLCLGQLRTDWRTLVSVVLGVSVLTLDICVEIKTLLTSILNVLVMSY